MEITIIEIKTTLNYVLRVTEKINSITFWKAKQYGKGIFYNIVINNNNNNSLLSE